MLGDGNRRVAFLGATADEAIARFGRLPLPPYITRDPTGADESAIRPSTRGWKAASPPRRPGCTSPPSCSTRCRRKGVVVTGLDLQVGPGTFKPVDVEDPPQHPMHPEHYEIPSRLPG